MKNVQYDQLTQTQRRALDAAFDAKENAYCPYSGFHVGAALYSASGTDIITGANVENAAYSPTFCAERSAIVRANAMGLRRFNGIAVIARGKDFETSEVTAPCGPCRQMLYELAQVSGVDKSFEVIMSTTKKDRIIIATIGELLPLAFGPKDLGVDVSDYIK